ncbi:MAG: cystatin domain-containing protein [Vibrio sp.]
MYKNILLASAATLAVAACSSGASESNTKVNIDCQTPERYATNLPGGWHKAEVTPEAKKAANLALSGLSGAHQVKEIKSVDQQVVAGMNYRVIFTIEDDSEYEAVVYRNVQGQYTITSIQKINPNTRCESLKTEEAQPQAVEAQQPASATDTTENTQG